MLPHRFHIGRGETGHADAVADEAADHGGIEHVRRAERAEQERPAIAEARPRLRPQAENAHDVVLAGIGQMNAFEALPDIHRAFAAQRMVARMHFGDHRAGHAARGIVLGPEPLAPALVRAIFENGEAVPNDGFAVPQDRHLARRGLEAVLLLGAFPLFAEHRHGDLLEGEDLGFR